MIGRCLDDGVVGNCIFHDSDGGEIIANTFGDVSVRNIDKIIEKDGVYIITRYKVIETLNKTFLYGNYSLNITSSTKIKKMPPDDIFININFHFFLIEDLFFFKE